MTKEEREKLITKLVDNIAETWDLDKLIGYAQDHYQNELEKMSDEDLKTEADFFLSTEKKEDWGTCPGWAHFNETQLEDGRILSNIQRCDSCQKLYDDDAALVEHDKTCKVSAGKA
jgi:hypothetical protein